jgi:predicted outer membrane repeat protein
MRARLGSKLIVCGRLGAAVALVTLVLLRTDPVAGASTTFVVNDTTDAALANSSGTTCVSTHSGGCTLRAAVQAADNLGGAVSITLPAGTYKYTIASTAADDPSTGDLDVTAGAAITITGQGASSTVIDPNGLDRAFAVQSGTALSISGVTIERGAQNDATTAPSYKSTKPGYSGAFYNDGTLLVSNSVFTDNSAADYGGGVYSDSSAVETSITNSTFTGSTAGGDDGGAVYVAAGTLSLTGDTITSNSADDSGGAIYDGSTGALTISGTTISGNVADGSGGALYDHGSGALSITNSTLDDDTGAYEGSGGAIYSDGTAAITVSGSTFSNDSAGAYGGSGGAIYDKSGPLTVAGSTFDNNASGNGGAIYMDGENLTVSGSTFSGNVASHFGGAIYVDGSSATAVQSITTSTFSDNSAEYSYGGAIYDSSGAGDLEISQSTFTGNDSYYGALAYDSGDGLALTNDTFDGNQGVDGGAIYFETSSSTGSIVLLNDTIAHNTGYDGGGIYEPSYANTIENTIVADNSGSVGTSGGGDCYEDSTDSAGAADVGGNIDSDGTCFGTVTSDHTSVNPGLAPLGSHGGTIQTDALYTTSPAVGEGVSSPLACPTSDERGMARSGSCDAGAFQIEATSTTVTSSNKSIFFGRRVTFTATVAGLIPSGTVTFKDGTTTLGTASLNASGQAAFATSALAIGRHAITAVYGGDDLNPGSTSAVLAELVNRAATRTALKLSEPKVTYGRERHEHLAVTVSPQFPGSMPTGTVTVKAATRTLCVIRLTLGKGRCTLSARKLNVGTYRLVANYRGSKNFKHSSSVKKILSVVK